MKEIQNILKEKKVVDVVGTSRPLISVSYDDSINDALKKLEDGKVFCGVVYSGPVIVGLIDMKDIVRNLVKVTRTEFKDFRQESVCNLIDAGKMFTQQVVGALIGASKGNPFQSVTSNTSLWEVVQRINNEKLQRLMVVDEHGKAVNIITQFDIVVFLSKIVSEKGYRANQTVRGIGSSPVACVLYSECSAHVFQMMKNQAVGGFAVVDSDGKLFGTICLSDLKGINEETFKLLSKEVADYLSAIHDGNVPSEHCNVTDTLDTLLSTMVHNKMHRIYLVNKDRRPVSVVSLSDILKCMVT